MTKKYKLYEYAQELYFEGSMTQEQIANQLGISEKTFRRWKNEYKWADAKKEFAKKTFARLMRRGNIWIYLNIGMILKQILIG